MCPPGLIFRIELVMVLDSRRRYPVLVQDHDFTIVTVSSGRIWDISRFSVNVSKTMTRLQGVSRFCEISEISFAARNWVDKVAQVKRNTKFRHINVENILGQNFWRHRNLDCNKINGLACSGYLVYKDRLTSNTMCSHNFIYINEYNYMQLRYFKRSIKFPK